MLRYVLRRLVAMVPVLLGVTLVTFLLTQVIPADPAAMIAGEYATDETIASIREQYGLDRPLPLQYVLYLGRLLQGDLGTSLFTGQPVAGDLAQFFMATAELATAAILIAVLVGVPAGVIAATHRNTGVDHLARIVATVGAATPVFWLALLLVAFLSARLGWFPISGRYDIDLALPPTITGSLILDSVIAGRFDVLVNTLWHLVLPAVTLGVMGAGLIARVMRSSMLEVLNDEYVTTARSKGLSERRVVYVHALRNAMLPALTVTGLTYGALLGGTVLTESIFGWPGLGRYAVDSILRLDFAALMGVVLVMTVAYAVVNLLVDLLYTKLNPLVTLTSSRRS